MDAVTAPPSSPGRPSPGMAASPWPRLVVGFVLDLLIAVSMLLVLAVLGVVAWGVVEGVEQAMRAPGGSGGTQSMPGPEALLWIGLLATAIAAGGTYLWRGRANAHERARSRQAAHRLSTWTTALLAGLAVFGFSSAVAWMGRLVGVQAEPTNLAPLEALMDRPFVLLALVVVLAPAYEELLFRRVLFGRFLRGGRPWLGLGLSSVAFAAFHEMPGASANAWPALAMLLLVYGGMGAAFAWVYWRCGTLWAPIIAHATNNLVAASLLLAGPAGA